MSGNNEKLLILYFLGCAVTLGELPDELLPALSKFLIIAKDDVDQGHVNSALVKKAREIVNCVTITCRNVEYIPLVDRDD